MSKNISGLFLKLKEIYTRHDGSRVPMAALTRLHLDTKQVATMPVISPDSVYKSRQRLRKRLQLDDESTTETYLTKI